MLDAGKIDGGDIKDRLAGTVRNASAAADIAVGAVRGEEFREQRGGAAARERLDEHEGRNFGRDPERAEHGGEQRSEVARKSACLEQRREHEDRRQIGKEGERERHGFFHAGGKAVVEFYFFEERVKKERKKELRNKKRKKAQNAQNDLTKIQREEDELAPIDYDYWPEDWDSDEDN